MRLAIWQMRARSHENYIVRKSDSRKRRINKRKEKELQEKNWMENKTGEIIFPNEKCKIFHQTTVTLGWVAYVSCEWKYRVGGAVREDLPCVCPVSEGNRSTAGLSCHTESPDSPAGGNPAHYIESGKNTGLQVKTPTFWAQLYLLMHLDLSWNVWGHC